MGINVEAALIHPRSADENTHVHPYPIPKLDFTISRPALLHRAR